MYKKIIVVAAMLGLSSCSAGMKPGVEYSNQVFEVPLSLGETYRRADIQLRECVPAATTTGSLYAQSGTAQIRAAMPPMSAGDMLRVDLRAISTTRTQVRIAVADYGVWDQKMIDSARRSIETGTIACRK